MDCAPNVNIFRELQVVHDTGYFSSQVSPEEDWQQVCETIILILQKKVFWTRVAVAAAVPSEK